MWDPWFSFPTINSELRAVKSETFMCDCGVGDMYLNFVLELKVKPHVRIVIEKSKLVKAKE